MEEIKINHNNQSSGIRLNHVNISKNKLFTIPNDQVVIIFSLNGEINISTGKGSLPVSHKSAIMIKQFSNFVVEVDTNFEGIICLLDSSSIISIANMLPLTIMSRDYYGENTKTELIVPPMDNLNLFIDSLKLYLPHSNFQMNDWKGISESKFCEFFWILNHSDVRNEFQSFIYNIQNSDRFMFEMLLEKNFRKNLRLKELADLAGYSVSTFKRKFEAIFNCSPGRWVLNRKLEEANLQLQVSDITISEIGFKVGFENTSHFIQAFKAKYGFTPKKMLHYNRRIAS